MKLILDIISTTILAVICILFGMIWGVLLEHKQTKKKFWNRMQKLEDIKPEFSTIINEKFWDLF